MSLDDQIPFEKLPMQAILSFMEINPPRLPFKSLLGAPKGVPFSILNEFVLTSDVTGFSMSLGGQLAQQNYAHLLIVLSVKSSTGADEDVLMGFNADGAAHYKWNVFGATASSSASDTSMFAGQAAGAGFAAGLVLVPNFLDASSGKSLVGVSAALGGASGVPVALHGGSWSGPAALSQLDFKLNVGNVKAGSRFSAYALGSQ